MVLTTKGDEVGTIENFLISDTANVEYSILSVGRFHGIGENWATKTVSKEALTIKDTYLKHGLLICNLLW